MTSLFLMMITNEPSLRLHKSTTIVCANRFIKLLYSEVNKITVSLEFNGAIRLGNTNYVLFEEIIKEKTANCAKKLIRLIFEAKKIHFLFRNHVATQSYKLKFQHHNNVYFKSVQIAETITDNIAKLTLLINNLLFTTMNKQNKSITYIVTYINNLQK